MVTLEQFKKIPDGDIFRVVTTRYQTTSPGNEITFVCKKGHGHHDWCIYYHLSTYPPGWIIQYGEKVTIDGTILSIFPCEQDVLDRYRY